MIKKIILTTLFLLSINAFSMNFEIDVNAGAQTSWPISGQFGFGGALNFPLTSLTVFPYASLDVNAVEYIDKTAYFKEVNYGLGAKIYMNSTIFRGSIGRVYRMYEGLSDESWRGEIGIGTKIQNLEVSINYRHYYPLDKHAVVIMTGLVF